MAFKTKKETHGCVSSLSSMGKYYIMMNSFVLANSQLKRINKTDPITFTRTTEFGKKKVME
jgi:hypothetical protein